MQTFHLKKNTILHHHTLTKKVVIKSVYCEATHKLFTHIVRVLQLCLQLKPTPAISTAPVGGPTHSGG